MALLPVWLPGARPVPAGGAASCRQLTRPALPAAPGGLAATKMSPGGWPARGSARAQVGAASPTDPPLPQQNRALRRRCLGVAAPSRPAAPRAAPRPAAPCKCGGGQRGTRVLHRAGLAYYPRACETCGPAAGTLRRCEPFTFTGREGHARTIGGFDLCCFCCVQRPEDHPLRPADYAPLDPVWSKFGYVRHPELTTTYSWKDVDQADETEKPMVFWLKPLSAAD